MVLSAVAGVLALIGKKQISQASPLAPERSVDNIKSDIAEIKDAARP